ncbi:MAG: efflux RND transporter periplasmic adaptor subunit [Xanthomonadales bacterium]|jgi:multidrug resistance efflux pump|nr:efflux RND transporter periplasmic adaptor subunit [Xanthomonadales bacterium]
MIAFLTLVYIAALFLAIKVGIIKLNTFWKISPVLWMVLLFLVLFVPMQWGAPSGAVRMYQAVIEVVPSVTGEVVEISTTAAVPLKKGDPIFKIDPTQYEAAVDRLEAQIILSEANLARAQDLMERGVGRQLDVDMYTAEVDSATAQLHNAQWELDRTVVRAPADGMVVGLALRPGQRVANLPMRSWVSFVEDDTMRLAVGIPQSRLRHVEVGQDAEVVLRMFPGRTLGATVMDIIPLTAGAQIQPSGLVPQAPTLADPALPYAVILELDDKTIELAAIPGGAVGVAAIYTDSVSATHAIRRVMMRMEAWMNYVKP